jgi:hypothetical protein
VTTRKLFYRRAFLNKPGFQSTGLILADVRVGRGADDIDLDAGLTIGDCGRQVSLDFGLWFGRGEHRKVNRGELANVRHKTATLRKAVNDFCDAVELGCDMVEADQ